MIRFEFPLETHPDAVVLGIGVFDGVHLGHKKIISELTALGRDLKAAPVAVTFFPHPREVLGMHPLPRLLLPPEERLRLLREAGAEGVGIIDFSSEIAETAPEAFVDNILNEHENIRGICVGSRWRFGRKGIGDTAFLADELRRREVAFRAVPELTIGGEIVSSSSIRDAVAGGDIAAATEMLGRYPAIYGEVEPGFQDAGSLLNTPTANVRPLFGVTPPDGVYATFAQVDDRRHMAVTDIGTAPTFHRGVLHRIETHLLDFSGDIYRKRIKVELVGRLRGEKEFPTVAELKHQIRLDVEHVRNILGGEAL